MLEKVNKFLLAGDKFMPEMHLRRPGFTCSACQPFNHLIKTKREYENLKKQRIQYIYIYIYIYECIYTGFGI